MRRSPERMSDDATQNSPYGASFASRTPSTSSSGTFGTFRFSTRGRVGARRRPSRAPGPRAAPRSPSGSRVSLHFDAHRERRDAEPGGGERGADRARVQDEVPGVRAGVDARRRRCRGARRTRRGTRGTPRSRAGARSRAPARPGPRPSACSATGIGSERCSGPIDAPAPLRSDAGRDDEDVVTGLVQRLGRARRSPVTPPRRRSSPAPASLLEPTGVPTAFRRDLRDCAAASAWATLAAVATVLVVGGGVLGTMHAFAAPRARPHGHPARSRPRSRARRRCATSAWSG